MPTFAPIEAWGEATPFTVQLGSPPTQRIQESPSWWVSRRQTQAVVAAAKLATGCQSAYALEAQFSPHPRIETITAREWSEGRDRVWDRWQRGESPIPRMMLRGSTSAAVRLDAVHAISQLPASILNMQFWRCLLNEPMTVAEVKPLKQEVGKFAQGALHSVPGDINHIRTVSSVLRAGIESPATRWFAIDGLWLRLRSCSMVTEICEYALAYMVWRNSQHVIAKDPVLGKIGPELFEFSALWFSRLQLMPETQETLVAASIALELAGLHTTMIREKHMILVEEVDMGHLSVQRIE